jgi:hypothetical protein
VEIGISGPVNLSTVEYGLPKTCAFLAAVGGGPAWVTRANPGCGLERGATRSVPPIPCRGATAGRKGGALGWEAVDTMVTTPSDQRFLVKFRTVETPLPCETENAKGYQRFQLGWYNVS